ncbi:MAG TPA: rod shape-determining protein RodA [Gaiellaceae bacterium]|nr:rod shape-determining protein RodA [Gaiellaceae bacterium]HET8653041.1 rod shape-determining protein RodA [Gaiellaceae bacterium]
MADYAAPAPTRARRHPRADTARAVSFVRRLDWVMLAAVAGLVGFGLWVVDGITRQDIPGDPDYYVTRQAIFALMGSVGLVIALFVDPSIYRRFRKAIYGLLLGMLLVVMVIGTEVRGSTRWIDLGFFQFQPSEFGKLLLALVLAGLLAERGRRITESRTTLVAIGAAAVPTLFVFLQPDIGTALVYGAILVAALFFAGTRWRDLGVIAAVGALVLTFVLWAGPAIGVDVLEPYQRDRLTAFTNPSKNPRGAAYNINQSITAVGSGGLDGRGVTGATQTRLDYLPEHETDFVFAALSEQRGFVGASILLSLYLLLMWRGIRVIATARDPFAATVAGAIVFGLLFQTFVNIGMTIGIAPITGIPLPFVSVGGSAMVTNLMAVGVLQAIALRRR